MNPSTLNPVDCLASGLLILAALVACTTLPTVPAKPSARLTPSDGAPPPSDIERSSDADLAWLRDLPVGALSAEAALRVPRRLGTVAHTSADRRDQPAGGLITTLHAVDDLTSPASDDSTESLDGFLIRRHLGVEEVAEYLRRFVDRPLAPSERITVVSPNELAVFAKPSTHQNIEALLQSLRAAKDQPVDIEVRLYRIPTDVFDQEFAPHLHGQAKAVDSMWIERPTELARLGRSDRIKMLRRMSYILAERWSQLPAERVSIHSGNTISCVSGFSAEITSSAAHLTPEATYHFRGLAVAVQVHRVPAGVAPSATAVDVHIQHGSVELPIPRRLLTYLGQEIILDDPESMQWAARFQATWQEPGIRLWSLPSEHGRHDIVWVQVR